MEDGTQSEKSKHNQSNFLLQHVKKTKVYIHLLSEATPQIHSVKHTYTHFRVCQILIEIIPVGLTSCEDSDSHLKIVYGEH